VEAITELPLIIYVFQWDYIIIMYTNKIETLYTRNCIRFLRKKFKINIIYGFLTKNVSTYVIYFDILKRF